MPVLGAECGLKLSTLGFTDHGDGRVTWMGTMVQGPTPDALHLPFSIGLEGNDIRGRFYLGDEITILEPVGDGLQVAYEIDHSRLPPEHVENPRRNRGEGELHESNALWKNTSTSSTPAVIDVLVVYTSQAASGINSLVSTAEIEANISLTNSGLDDVVFFNVVSVIQVPYTETGDLIVDRDRLANPSDGYMDVVHTWRDQYGADVVTLITLTGNANGQAKATGASSSQAFTVVKKDALQNNLSLGHELGHIIGAHHDEDLVPEYDEFLTYGHAHNNSVGFRTMMSIKTQPRIPYWSDPGRNFYVNQTPYPLGIVDLADNVRALEYRSSTVEGFKPSHNPIPDVFVSGPTALGWKQTATLIAYPSFPGTESCSNCTYKWYHRPAGGSWNFTGVTTQTLFITFAYTSTQEYKAEVYNGGSTPGSGTISIQYNGTNPTGDHHIDFESGMVVNSLSGVSCNQGYTGLDYFDDEPIPILTTLGINDLAGQKQTNVPNWTGSGSLADRNQ